MFNYGKYLQRLLRICFSTKITLRYVFKMSAFGKNAVFSVMNATGQWMHQ